MVSRNAVEKAREGFRSLSDDELIVMMHSWAEHSPDHIAAKLEIKSREEKKASTRFHLVFWPSFFAALAALFSFFTTY